LSIRDVAERLKVSQRTIRRWIDQGYLEIIKIGRTVRIEENKLIDLVRNSGKPARGSSIAGEMESGSVLAEEVFARTWNNPQDAIYDQWRDVYDVRKGRRRAGRLSVSR
jgi:excisionase family DNA binding protein